LEAISTNAEIYEGLEMIRGLTVYTRGFRTSKRLSEDIMLRGSERNFRFTWNVLARVRPDTWYTSHKTIF